MKKLIFLCLLLPAIAKAQILNMTNIKQPPNLNPTLQPSVSSPFDLGSVVVGNPGTDFTFNLNGISLTAATAVLTATGNVELSKDGTTWANALTYSVSGGTITGQPVTIHNRMKSTAPQGSLTGASVTITSSGAPPVTINYTGTVTATPTLSANPTSVTGLNGITGTPGTPTTVAITFQATTVTATDNVTGTEISKDGGSTWSNIQTFSTGSPLGLKIRTQSSAAVGAISGNLVLTGTNGVASVTVPVSGNVASNATTPDSVRLQFGITSANLVSGWTGVFGDPTAGVISFTIPGTTITVSSVSTASANWTITGGCSCGAEVNNGYLTGQTLPYSGSTGVMAEAWYNQQNYQTTNAQVVVGGLKTDGTTYDIELSGSVKYPYSAVTLANVKGASLQTTQGVGNAYQNTSGKATWTAVQPDASGNISFYMGRNPGDQIGCLSYIIIRKH